MRDHLKRLAAVAATLAASGTVGLSPSIAAASAAAADTARATFIPGAVRPAAARPSSARPLLLITGEQLQTRTTDGHVYVTEVRPAAAGVVFLILALVCAGRIEVPADALPYLGRGLDPRLFELASLRRAEAGGRLPVRVGFQGHIPVLPGVTLTTVARTRSGHGTASGYLTARSARLFGIALARQFRADHADASYGADGLFADGVSIALAGAAASSGDTGVRPHFPMHTLIVDGTNLAGQPDTGDAAVVFNTDNCLWFGDPQASVNSFFHGQTRFSVPTGHYLAMGLFFSGGFRSGRLAFLTRVTVRRDTTIHVREPGGGTKITMITPRPAIATDTDFKLLLHQRSGSWLGIELYSSGAPIWLAGLDHAKAGTTGLATYTSQNLFSPARGPKYVYDLDIAGPPGEIPVQHFIISPSSLATVTNRFYSDIPSQGFWSTASDYPLAARVIGFAFAPYPLRLPGTQLRYLTGARSLDWVSFYWPFQSFNGQYSDNTRSFTPGERTTIDWNRYPLHPGANANPVGRMNSFPLVPSASRRGDILSIDTMPFSDNTPGHFGAGYCPYGNTRGSGRYEIDQNGIRIAAGTAASVLAQGSCDLFVSVRLSGRPSVIRLTTTASRSGRQARLSTATRATWIWHSRRRPGATLPPGWFCSDFRQQCAVDPMMTLLYTVYGESLSGSTKPGRQAIRLDVGHLQLAQARRVTGARLSVSFNDGRTWQRARVTRTGRGKFFATFNALPGAYVTLRAQAADAAGGSVTETITRAYRVSGASRTEALRAACPAARMRFRCFALFRPQTAVNAAIAAGRHGAVTAPAGLGPRQLESAYKLPVSVDPHQTVAVVDAYSTPHLAEALALYRHRYGLPSCTVASGCLRIVNQRGKPSPLPASGVPFGWDVETMLDVEMVSAACPLCHILVVEANDSALASLPAAENTAARLGAAAISNSYGIGEFGLMMTFARSYDHRGHAIVVSSGDTGFTSAQFPADLATVTAVGGTQLARARNARGWTERVWDTGGGAGSSGCSSYIAKPAWQHDPHCGMRTVADVSAIAWNLAVYDPNSGGWLTVGGTSAAAPFIAGVYGLAGNATKVGPGYVYQHARSLFDITKGNNDLLHSAGGATCGYDYLCVAKPGYDAPTGLGTPDGIGAF